MQSAKKLVLVDEFDRKYKRLQRPTAAVVKANHWLCLSNTLRNSSLADDRKVKQYVGELHRYLTVDKFAEQSTPVAINWITNPEPRKRAVEKKKNKKNGSSCHAHVTEGPILMHSTFFPVLPAVFQAFVICNVTAGVACPK